MFEEREDYSEAVAALCRAFLPLDRGDTLTNAEIEAVIGYDASDRRFRRIVAKAMKRILADRKIATYCVPGVGCKLLTEKEHLDRAPYRRRRAQRQIARGIRELKALPESLLTPAQLFQKAARLDALRREHRELKAQQKVDAVLARPSETLPRAPRRQATSA